VAKVFSTHPPTDDRIRRAQKNIQEILKARPEYVVTTSEFEEVKARLAIFEHRRHIDDSQKKDDRPTLRRRTAPTPGDGSDHKDSDDQDERPTLKRRQ
jgi:hypothetical protein